MTFVWIGVSSVQPSAFTARSSSGWNAINAVFPSRGRGIKKGRKANSFQAISLQLTPNVLVVQVYLHASNSDTACAGNLRRRMALRSHHARHRRGHVRRESHL